MAKRTVLGLMICLFTLSSCAPRELPEVNRTTYLLDTIITIRLYDWKDEETLNRVMEEIVRLEALLSVEKEGSDLDRLHQAAGQDWVMISPECQEVLERAKEIYVLSQGYFDVSAGPLIDLWSIGSDEKGHYPTEEERLKALEKISAEQLLVEDGRAFLQEAGMKVNLGAIAKGYIADKVKALLVSEGVQSGVLDVGRNILLLGEKSDKSPYQIGVQSPLDGEAFVAILTIPGDLSVVTSGIDQRFFEYEGKRYHHILDPFTGYPSDTGVASVTILSEESMMGDALSTTCLLLGEEKGLALIEQLPGVEALFVLSDGQTRESRGFSMYRSEG